MIKKLFYIPFIIVLLSTSCLVGQTRKQLEKQRKKLSAQIHMFHDLIDETKENQKNALEDLKEINHKITVRKELINTINKESTLLLKEIVSNKIRIEKLTKKLKALKEDYADMIFKSYKSKSQQSRAMFLLSSKNFRQAYKRLEYMKQYTQFRKNQGEDIDLQANLLQQFVDSLSVQKRIKDTLILSEKEHKTKIEEEKNNQESIVSKIKNKEKKYKKELQKSIKKEQKVKEKIDKLIREAIARANKKAKKNAGKKAVKTKKNEFILSPEAKALAIKFELNKGKLPWPLTESLVTRRFGKQPHPTFGGITLNSPGLHLMTKKGAFAKAVFGGKVLAIQLTSERKKNVLVQHGNYITAYNNLENSLVKMGDKVITGQKLGTVYTDKVTGKTKLIFVLFKNTARLNPANWMLKR